MAQRDTIVVGASAGGVQALQALLGALPADLPAAVVVVLHTPPTGVSALAAILARSTRLRVMQAEQDERLQHGTVLVARSDHHVVIIDDHVRLSRGPRENGHRPAVDVLFRSAAVALGPRVIGVVLSGSLDDGAAGMVAIRSRGGIGMVQDPDEALASGMPLSAIRAAQPEHVLPLAQLSVALQDAIGAEVMMPDEGAADLLRTETALAELRAEALGGADRPGVPAGLSCPDCHGTLFEIDDAGYVRYRCRVGHAWSAASLQAENDTVLETALWTALRVLEEKAALARGMADRAAGHGSPLSATRFQEQAGDTTTAAEAIRRLLVGGAGITGAGEPPPSERQRP